MNNIRKWNYFLKSMTYSSLRVNPHMNWLVLTLFICIYYMISLQLLNWFAETWRYVFVFYIISLQRWYRWYGYSKYFLVNKDMFILNSHYDWWWLGDTWSQGINSHGIDLILLEYSGFITRKVNVTLFIYLSILGILFDDMISCITIKTSNMTVIEPKHHNKPKIKAVWQNEKEVSSFNSLRPSDAYVSVN